MTNASKLPGQPAAAEPTHVPATTLGWKSLRSEMVQPLKLAPHNICAVTPFDVTIGQFSGAILEAFFWPTAPPDPYALLVHSLSHTLSAFPTFCGRFLESCELEINNAGVAVEFGECTATLTDVLPPCHEQQMFVPLNLDDLNPPLSGVLTKVIAEHQPVVSVKIGTLADGALVVVVIYQHSLADATSIRQLMRDWAATTRAMLAGQTPAVPEPYEYGRAWYDKLAAGAAAMDPAAPFDPNVSPSGSGWVHVPFSQRPPFDLPPATPVVLYVSKERLAELKTQATQQLKANGSTVEFISTYDALMARLRQVMASVPGRGASRATASAMTCNLRPRVHAAGRPGELLCQQTAVGNLMRAALGEVLDDPTTADLGTLAAASRACINHTCAASTAEAAWGTRAERERGLPSFLEYMCGKLDLFGPFPDFILSKWDFTPEELDLGSGPAVWIQGQSGIPELGLAVPALMPGTEGGMFVCLIIRNNLLDAVKAMPYPI